LTGEPNVSVCALVEVTTCLLGWGSVPKGRSKRHGRAGVRWAGVFASLRMSVSRTKRLDSFLNAKRRTIKGRREIKRFAREEEEIQGVGGRTEELEDKQQKADII